MPLQHYLENPSTWTSIAFFIFLFFAFRPIFKAVTAALDKRSERIREELNEAARLREEAQSLLGSYQRRQHEAEAEAEEIVRHARESGDLMIKEAEQQLEQLLNKRIQQAMLKIGQAEEAAAKEVREKMLTLASDMTRQVLKNQMTGAKSAELVQEALGSLPKKLH